MRETVRRTTALCVRCGRLAPQFGVGFALCLALAAGATAADLPDPTRPPAAVAATEGGDAVEVEQPVLQSVMISPTRRIAIISGQAVALGATFRGARLIKVTEGEVVLRDGNETRTLTLFPDLHKQPLAGHRAEHRSGKPAGHAQ